MCDDKFVNEPEGVFTAPDEGQVLGTVIVNPADGVEGDPDAIITLRKTNVDENGDFDLEVEAKAIDRSPLDTIQVTISVAKPEEDDDEA